MPFARPTLTELRTQAANDIDADLAGSGALLRYSNLGILGAMLAALANGHYGYLDWIARQSVPFTATDEYLEGWAALKGVTRKPATAASGYATFPGSVTLSAGAAITRGDGVAYVSTADAPASGGSVVVPIVATTPGATTNAPIGTGMVLDVAVVGITATGTVSTALTGGADIELDDDLRSRMLAEYAAPPQGGAQRDYPEWALEVPGVTRAWAYANSVGAGTVSVLFMMDDVEAAYGGFPQGSNGVASVEPRDTPATGDQLLVANALYGQQPVTALVYAAAPIANTIGLTIAGIPGVSGATQAAIAAAVRKALLLEAQPGGVTDISAIEAAIAAVAGTAGFVLTAVTASAGTVSPGSAGNITSNTGALPVLGAIAYV